MNSPAITGTQATVDLSGSAPDVQRIGGIAAHVVAGTYVVGFLTMLVYLVPRGFTDGLTDPAASLEFLTDHRTATYAWYLVLYLLGGAALPVLVIALRERLHTARPTATRIATIFGLIWSGLLLASGMIALVGQRAVVDLATTDRATAVASWHALSAVQDAIGGGIELVGALWLLLVCLAGLRSRVFPTVLAVLGIILGIAGLWTLLPATADAAASLFGLGLIVWFTWTAQTLLAGAKKLRNPSALGRNSRGHHDS